jgi:hypothetical protein
VTGWPDGQMMREAMEGITRFYAPPRATTPVTAAANPAGPIVTRRF